MGEGERFFVAMLVIFSLYFLFGLQIYYNGSTPPPYRNLYFIFLRIRGGGRHSNNRRQSFYSMSIELKSIFLIFTFFTALHSNNSGSKNTILFPCSCKELRKRIPLAPVKILMYSQIN